MTASILRQEFLTSAVEMHIDAEVIRAGLLNRQRKENSACVSRLQEQIVHGSREQAARAGMLLEQTGSPGGSHAACSPGRDLVSFFAPLNKLHVPV